LDSGADFWLKLRGLGTEMIQMETQLIFLTATLSPQDQEEFFQAMCISAKSVQMFCGSTSWRNIQYQIQEVEEETVVETVHRLVEQKLKQYPVSNKIVVYRDSVAQTVEIGEALGCPIYHRSIDDRAGKARRIKDLISGRSWVIAATNALGMEMDLFDIWVVIYTGQPQKLRDYTQETGCAERDGQSSEAIIVASRQVEGVQPSQTGQRLKS
jgi:superfamily II DNA helicase RecQ